MTNHAITADTTREAERLQSLYDKNVRACTDHQNGKNHDGSRKLAAPLPSQALSAPTSTASP